MGLVATHSATLIASAQSGEVVGIGRSQRTARRYTETGTALCQMLELLPES